MKTAIVLGIRPQFIKLAPLIKEMIKNKLYFDLIHTGQHYDQSMSEVFFKELKINKPKYNLKIGSGTQGYQTANAILGLEKLFLSNKYDLVIVIGDATPTLSGALTASKLQIPIMHIESGLRSFDKRMPEEVNRIVVDHISEYLIVPTKNAAIQLLKEGIDKKNIFEFGDITVDILHSRIKQLSIKKKEILKEYNLSSSEKYVLVTIHRAENTDNINNLKEIFSAINQIGKTQKVICPIHPRTKNTLLKNNLNYENVVFIDSQGYDEFLVLLKNSSLFITDSGGAQKEAFILGIPTITCRKSTEWIETTKNNANVIVDADYSKIIKYSKIQQNKKIKPDNCFGDGKTTHKIIKLIKNIKKLKGQ